MNTTKSVSLATGTATIALMGQPNVGKSTIFNMLTGLNQHVGNWPGKTVERRTGTFEHDGVHVEIIDLPGTYCLTAASPEERVARDYIIQSRPDVVLVILNAAALERNLYLVTELLALPAPIVIGLNMLDVAREQGFDVEPAVLSAAIGVPVIAMTASRGEGVRELIDVALDVVRNGPAQTPSRPEIRPDHREVMEEMVGLVTPHVPAGYPSDWIALKLLEGDEEITDMMRAALPEEVRIQVDALLRQHEDALIAVASGRYEWIRRMTRAALKRPRAGHVTLTLRLDRVATHPFGGLVMLAAVLALIFGLTYSIGAPLQEWLAERVVGALATWAAGALASAPAWISGLEVDGILGGVGTVLTFVPILVIFFACMGFLEDVGYMARAAYVMDRFMHALGLHGKSFMPLFLGFGCNVPAIMGARVIESPRGRLLTIMLAPLVPCTARLAVVAVLAPAFFPQHATLVTWLLTGLPLVVLAVSGALVSRIAMRPDDAAFIMEMPLYHLPNARTIGLLVWERTVAFLKKAATVILVVSAVVWLLATLPHGAIESSYLAAVGRFLSPVGALMGLDWKPLVALLASFVAKENSVATLGVLYGVGEEAGALAGALQANMSVASGLAFLVAEMLFIPCVSTVAVVRQETGSWRWALLNVAALTLLAIGGGAIAYRLALLFL
ncbi:MAG TPA: ferrous iron transport protein B [Chloroflexi bacterium]|nr:ferrous iron transport protein B [Chloroflexota bacterium]